MGDERRSGKAVEVRRIEFHTPEVRIVGDRWSSERVADRGTLLLLHGGGQRRYSWHRTGERMANEGWTVYAIDSRGHGDSGRAPDGDYSIDAFVRDASAVASEIETQPVIAGASLGGMTAIVGEGENPGLARALVLVDVVAQLEPRGVERIHAFMGARPDGFSSLSEASDAIAAYNPNRPRPASLDGLRKNLIEGPDGRWRWHWDPAFLRTSDDPRGGANEERAAAAAAAIQVPTLLVRGANSDIVSEDGFLRMHELIPQAQLSRVSAGHMIAGDDNDVFTSELTRFLTEL